MKKLLFIGAFLLTGLIATAQGQFNGGVHLGLPISDAGDFTTFSFIAEFNYLFEVSDGFEVGPSIGYTHSFGDEIEVLGVTIDYDDFQYIPIAASGRYHPNDKFWFGFDTGYAISVDDASSGGFYYSPRIAYNLGEKIDLVGAYRGISDDGFNFNILSLGIEYSF